MRWSATRRGKVSQLSDVEFFAARDPDVATLQGNDRKTAIKRLKDDNPLLWKEFNLASRAIEAANTFFRSSGRFSLTATGKINTYSLFAEHFSRLARAPQKPEPAGSIAQIVTDSSGVRPTPPGRAGVIVPTGIADGQLHQRLLRRSDCPEPLECAVRFRESRKFIPSRR